MEWPFSYNPEEDMISVNQRMVGMLINRESILKERSIKDKRLAKAFGRGVGRFRDQIPQARIECAAKVGLDSGFLALVESGDSLIEEITREDIFEAIVLSISTEDNIDECRQYLNKILKGESNG